jgi:ribosomal protein S12 methylthiotransferase accessory factor
MAAVAPPGNAAREAPLTPPVLKGVLKDGKTIDGRSCSVEKTGQTLAAALARAAKAGRQIGAETRRADHGRLGIPVWRSLPGDHARRIMPENECLGQGATEEQAAISSTMALIERYSFHAFWERLPRVGGRQYGTWSEIEPKLGSGMLPLEEILISVHAPVSPSDLYFARQLLDLAPWTFVPALHLGEGREVWLPAEWFRLLNETNGCSSGCTVAESILHGACELIERHVCSIIAHERRVCPSIRTDDLGRGSDMFMAETLLHKFTAAQIRPIIKDFSLHFPVPTVAVLAVDPGTFPKISEMIFAAATGTSPRQALARALLETARLGNDFCFPTSYNPIGLPRYINRAEGRWLEEGPKVGIESLPDLAAPDVLEELLALVGALRQSDIQMYSLDMTAPELAFPVHYTVGPRLDLYCRETEYSLGWYVGRRLAEQAPPDMAKKGLDAMDRLLPDADYTQFCRGILALRCGHAKTAEGLFAVASSLQKRPEKEALFSYYGACCHVVLEDWSGALSWLDRAIAVVPAMSQAWSLRGICRFNLKEYASAAENFKAALRRNKASAVDMANLGACFAEMGEKDQARVWLEGSLKLEPTLNPARQRLEDLR